MRASPQFLGPMRHVKGSGFKQGTLRSIFTELLPSEEKPAEWAEMFVPVFWLLLPLSFWEVPSAAGAFVHFLPGAISDKVVRTLTDEAALLLLFINLDSPGHPYCESQFSIICLTEKVGNVEARVVI